MDLVMDRNPALVRQSRSEAVDTTVASRPRVRKSAAWQEIEISGLILSGPTGHLESGAPVRRQTMKMLVKCSFYVVLVTLYVLCALFAVGHATINGVTINLPHGPSVRRLVDGGGRLLRRAWPGRPRGHLARGGASQDNGRGARGREARLTPLASAARSRQRESNWSRSGRRPGAC